MRTHYTILFRVTTRQRYGGLVFPNGCALHVQHIALSAVVIMQRLGGEHQNHIYINKCLWGTLVRSQFVVHTMVFKKGVESARRLGKHTMCCILPMNITQAWSKNNPQPLHPFGFLIYMNQIGRRNMAEVPLSLLEG